MGTSRLQRLVQEHGEERVKQQLTAGEWTGILRDWDWIGRDEQQPPPGDWRYWLYLAGRGTGKTRAGAELTIAMAKDQCPYPNLVGATASDVRDVMVEGESGILGCAPPDFYPRYEPSKTRLTWPNGITSNLYTAEKPDRLRGPQHGFVWAEEMAAWKSGKAWDMAKMGLRIGPNPRAVITTTPQPRRHILELNAHPRCVITTGTTYDNAANLAPAFLEAILEEYEGTSLGRQEIYAVLLSEREGALWNRAEMIDAHRVLPGNVPDLHRIVVAIDPAASIGTHGIVVFGVAKLNGKLHGYVLDDGSMQGKPAEWAQRACYLYDRWEADAIVAEVNNGGDMVESTIEAEDHTVSVIKVHASRGKIARAEPVSARYQKGRVHHAGVFADLEDQMCNYDGTPDPDGSPDRMDALVWGATETMLDAQHARPSFGSSTDKSRVRRR